MKDEVADRFSDLIWNAIKKLQNDYRAGQIVDEDDFTSQLVRALTIAVEEMNDEDTTVWSILSLTEKDGPPIPSVRLRARRLTSKGPKTEESLYGADMVLVLDINLPGWSVKKGMLVQAKIVDRKGEVRDERERRRLMDQCQSMIDTTPASFVFTYGPDKITAFSAATILASGARDIRSHSTYSIDIFFKDFLVCWIGDPDLQAVGEASLAAVRALTNARSAVLIKGERFD